MSTNDIERHEVRAEVKVSQYFYFEAYSELYYGLAWCLLGYLKWEEK